MKSFLLSGAALLVGLVASSCTYNSYPPPEEVHYHHYHRTTTTTKSAAVGGTSVSGSPEGFQAVTPPHSYSQ